MAGGTPHVNRPHARRLGWRVRGTYVAFALWICGCSLGDSTTGDRGRLEFQHSDLLSCVLGCELSPFVVGAEADVEVHGLNSDREYEVESTDEDVFDAELFGDRIELHALGAGQAELRVLDGRGRLVDNTTIEVAVEADVELRVWLRAEPEELRLEPEPGDDRRWRLRVGDSVNFGRTLFDADGRELIDEGALSWSSSNPDVLEYGFFDTTFSAREAGEAELVISTLSHEHRFTFIVEAP